MADYKKQGTFYDGKPPITSFLTNPLTGIYELFGATPNRAKRFAADSKDEIQYAEIHRRYNVALVRRVTSASDTVAKQFMEFYTPSFEDLKGWNDYELIKQIKKSWEYFEASSDKTKLAKHQCPVAASTGETVMMGEVVRVVNKL